jgi:hypothetical protein
LFSKCNKPLLLQTGYKSQVSTLEQAKPMTDPRPEAAALLWGCGWRDMTDRQISQFPSTALDQ